MKMITTARRANSPMLRSTSVDMRGGRPSEYGRTEPR